MTVVLVAVGGAVALLIVVTGMECYCSWEYTPLGTSGHSPTPNPVPLNP